MYKNVVFDKKEVAETEGEKNWSNEDSASTFKRIFCLWILSHLKSPILTLYLLSRMVFSAF